MSRTELTSLALAVGISAAGVAVAIALCAYPILGAIEKAYPERWRAL